MKWRSSTDTELLCVCAYIYWYICICQFYYLIILYSLTSTWWYLALIASLRIPSVWDFEIFLVEDKQVIFSVPLEEERRKFVLLVIFYTTNMENKCCLWPHTHTTWLLWSKSLPLKSVSNTVVLENDRCSPHLKRALGVFRMGGILDGAERLASVGGSVLFQCCMRLLKAALQVGQT